jgi:diaminopimelate epimerase
MPGSINVVKMHSLRNTILVIPPHEKMTWSSETIRAISDVQTGIGADQVMVCQNLSEKTPSPLKTSIWNRDGSMALACGNGMRCVLAYLSTGVGEIVTLYGPVGPVQGWKMPDHTIAIAQGSVTIGLDSSKQKSMLSPATPASDLPETRFWISSLQRTVVGIPAYIGNAHAIVLGPVPQGLSESWLAHNGDFPDGINVSFVWPKLDRTPANFSEHTRTDWLGDTFFVKTWERGVGLTQGCGSASCAIAEVLFTLQTMIQPDQKPSYTLMMPGGPVRLWRDGLNWVHCATVEIIAHCDWYPDQG